MKRSRGGRRRGWEVLCPTLHAVRRMQAVDNAVTAFLNGAEDAAVAKVAQRPSRWVGLPAAPALSRATREFSLRRSLTLREFLLMVLQPTLRTALDFPALFAPLVPPSVSASPPLAETGGSSDDSGGGAGQKRGATRLCCVAVNQRSVELTRRQVWCLLGNMFFCAFRPRTEALDDDATPSDEEDGDAAGREADWVDAGLLPTADYAEMHAAPDEDCGVEVTKLLLLFDFFMDAQGWTAEEGRRVELRAHRCRAAPSLTQALLPKLWCASPSLLPLAGTPLRPVVLHRLGESIDDQQDMVRLDFANKWIGGGALSSGAVQEEVTFAQCPALNVLRWFQSRMGHAESVAASHYRQYGRVAAGSYGHGLRYGAALQPPLPCRGALLAVDALNYQFDSVDECSRAAVYRELVKLASGLCDAALADLVDVAGGNWGCGVFGGDYELKFLLQWAACGVAGKVLHYFPFDKDAFASFVPLATRRCAEGSAPPLTTASLISFLYELEDASDSDDEGDDFGFVWSAFLRHFRLLGDGGVSEDKSASG